MTTTTYETEIVADTALPRVTITRVFDAPRAKVFRAHTDADLLSQWQAPHQYEVLVEEFDCRTGGAYRYVHTDGRLEHRFHGTFHEVRPDELIVQTFQYEGTDAVALERVTFEDLGDGRTRIVGTSLAESFEARDAFLATGMENGVRECFERLDTLLASA